MRQIADERWDALNRHLVALRERIEASPPGDERAVMSLHFNAASDIVSEMVRSDASADRRLAKLVAEEIGASRAPIPGEFLEEVARIHQETGRLLEKATGLAAKVPF